MDKVQVSQQVSLTLYLVQAHLVDTYTSAEVAQAIDRACAMDVEHTEKLPNYSGE